MVHRHRWATLHTLAPDIRKGRCRRTRISRIFRLASRTRRTSRTRMDSRRWRSKFHNKVRWDQLRRFPANKRLHNSFRSPRQPDKFRRPQIAARRSTTTSRVRNLKQRHPIHRLRRHQSPHRRRLHMLNSRLPSQARQRRRRRSRIQAINHQCRVRRRATSRRLQSLTPGQAPQCILNHRARPINRTAIRIIISISSKAIHRCRLSRRTPPPIPTTSTSDHPASRTTRTEPTDHPSKTRMEVTKGSEEHDNAADNEKSFPNDVISCAERLSSPRTAIIIHFSTFT